MTVHKMAVLIALVMLFGVSPTRGQTKIISLFLPASFQPGSEPDGFRGIKWEQDISTLKDMEHITEPAWAGRTKKYKRNGDILKIGSAHLGDISYYFWDGKFYFVLATFKGANNWERLKEVCFKMFGYQKMNITEYKGIRYGSNYEERTDGCEWEGSKTSLNIKYSYCLDYGSLSISSQAMAKKDAAFTKGKAREGQGF
jgi:hypothetical protein